MNKWICAFALALLLPACGAGAQGQPGYKVHSHDMEPPIVKAKNAPKVAEKDLADVILANTMENLADSGDEHFHKGEWNHIINLSRIIVQGEPWRVEVFSNNAWLLWSSDRNEQALAFLKQGIAANPDSYFLLDEMGYHLGVNLKQPTQALPYYEKAMKLKPESYPRRRPEFYTAHNLARCYEKTGQWDKALEIWEIAVNMPISSNIPNNPVAEQGVRRVKAKLAQKP